MCVRRPACNTGACTGNATGRLLHFLHSYPDEFSITELSQERFLTIANILLPPRASSYLLECATGLVHRAPPCQLQRPKPFHLQLQLHRFILQRQRLRHHTDNVFHANTGVCYGVSPPCASLPTSTSKAISRTTSTPPLHTTTITSTPPQRQRLPRQHQSVLRG